MTATEPSRRFAHEPAKLKKRKRVDESQSQKKRKSPKPAGVNGLPWKEVPLPENLDDAEGFFRLEEISDVELVRDEKLGRVEYRVGKRISYRVPFLAQLLMGLVFETY